MTSSLISRISETKLMQVVLGDYTRYLNQICCITRETDNSHNEMRRMFSSWKSKTASTTILNSGKKRPMYRTKKYAYKRCHMRAIQTFKFTFQNRAKIMQPGQGSSSVALGPTFVLFSASFYFVIFFNKIYVSATKQCCLPIHFLPLTIYKVGLYNVTLDFCDLAKTASDQRLCI